MSRLLFGICLLLATLIACNGIEQQEEVISFNTHIRPILSDKCFKCHGPDEKKRISGYRLDTEEGAYALLKDQKNKYGIVAGHPETSDVYRRITSTDPEYMMPPPEENLALTKEEIALIGKWISQGARYEKQTWSYLLKKERKNYLGGYCTTSQGYLRHWPNSRPFRQTSQKTHTKK